jgi:hypothetical protein
MDHWARAELEVATPKKKKPFEEFIDESITGKFFQKSEG